MSDDNNPEIIEISADSQLITQGEGPPVLHILPLQERPFFPGQVMPVFVDKEEWEGTIDQIKENGNELAGLILFDTDEKTDKVDLEKAAATGCLVRIHDIKHMNGQIRFIAQGLSRFKVKKWLTKKPPLAAQVKYPLLPTEDPIEVRAFANSIIQTVKELLPLNPMYSEELKLFLNQFSPNDPAPFTDFVINLTSASKHEMQEVLDTLPIVDRMEKALRLLQKELEVARVQTEIRQRVDERLTEQQRKFFLKEQLKEIQKELGISKDDRAVELDRFKERLAVLSVPDVVQEKIDEEMNKMSLLEIGSPEYAVTRNYLDWVTKMPWGVFSEDRFELEEARNILDEGHEGLADVKERMLEFLAVGAYRGEISGSIILLVGPPGVGKTSIGKSIADALGREFFRFSVGGMRDEAEIKGHRRTYIGAMPGKLVQALKDVGSSNPVIMLDEIDKMGNSYNGDPASALLEVLDPSQNSSFLDHYLDVPVDLSNVLFVCTANQLDTIPRPLLDRMETIHLAGYIGEEKLAIAKKHLLPKQLNKAGVKPSKVKVSDAALRFIIEGYAREAGVRNLDKQIGRIIRKSVVRLINKDKSPIRVGKDQVEEMLGQPYFTERKAFSHPGVVTGLAWTSMGGATLDIEATVVHKKSRGIKLSGQLGKVMQESAELAYSYLSATKDEFNIDEDFFNESFIHLHVPEGATPKDGPSAGITMATAILSVARDKPIRKHIAMTGEITLTGRVFAVGGIREKVIAARRLKLKELIIPAANQRDFEELPDYLKKGLVMHFVSDFHEVESICFGRGNR